MLRDARAQLRQICALYIERAVLRRFTRQRRARYASYAVVKRMKARDIERRAMLPRDYAMMFYAI